MSNPTNPIRGPSSSNKSPSEDGKPIGPQEKKIEKVEKTSEVDPDENRAKANKFRKMVDETPPPEKRKNLCSTSPFDLMSDSSSKSNSLKKNPPIEQSPKKTSEEKPSLPKSKEFWKDTDTPPKHSIKKPKADPNAPIDKELVGGLFPQMLSSTEALPPIKEDKNVSSSNVFAMEESFDPLKEDSSLEKELSKTALPSSKEPPSKKGKMTKEPLPEERKPSETKAFVPIHKEEKKEAETPQQKNLELPSTEPLPAPATQVAAAATQVASPYLNSEVLPLFYQMVGVIQVQAQAPGITETQVTLNNPAFSGSKFFGATITFEKYSTAPNSFNIRLSGSNEAVKAFQQNLGALQTAFHRGNFSFVIGRLEAEYKAERPLFRRKEKPGSKGDTSSDKGGNNP